MNTLCEDGTVAILDIFKIYGSESLRQQVEAAIATFYKSVLDSLLVCNPSEECLAYHLGALRHDLAAKESDLGALATRILELEETSRKATWQNGVLYGQLRRRIEYWDVQRRKFIVEIVRLKQQLWQYQNRKGYSVEDDPFRSMDLSALTDLAGHEDEANQLLACLKDLERQLATPEPSDTKTITRLKEEHKAQLDLLRFKAQESQKETAQQIEELVKACDSDKEKIRLAALEHEAELHCLRKKHNDLELEADRLRKDNQAVTLQVKELQTDSSFLQIEVQRLTTELKQCEESLKTKDDTCRQLQADVEKLQATVTRFHQLKDLDSYAGSDFVQQRILSWQPAAPSTTEFLPSQHENLSPIAPFSSGEKATGDVKDAYPTAQLIPSGGGCVNNIIKSPHKLRTHKKRTNSVQTPSGVHCSRCSSSAADASKVGPTAHNSASKAKKSTAISASMPTFASPNVAKIEARVDCGQNNNNRSRSRSRSSHKTRRITSPEKKNGELAGCQVSGANPDALLSVAAKAPEEPLCDPLARVSKLDLSTVSLSLHETSAAKEVEADGTDRSKSKKHAVIISPNRSYADATKAEGQEGDQILVPVRLPLPPSTRAAETRAAHQQYLAQVEFRDQPMFTCCPANGATCLEVTHPMRRPQSALGHQPSLRMSSLSAQAVPPTRPSSAGYRNTIPPRRPASAGPASSRRVTPQSTPLPATVVAAVTSSSPTPPPSSTTAPAATPPSTLAPTPVIISSRGGYTSVSPVSSSSLGSSNYEYMSISAAVPLCPRSQHQLPIAAYIPRATPRNPSDLYATANSVRPLSAATILMTDHPFPQGQQQQPPSARSLMEDSPGESGPPTGRTLPNV